MRLIPLLLIFLFLPVVSVYAQNATDSGNASQTQSPILEEFLQRRENARIQSSEGGSETSEQINEQRQQFNQRAAQISDTTRRSAILEIDSKIQLLNESTTDQLDKVLTSLTGIIEQIEQKKDKGTQNSSIQVARSALDDAKEKVENQGKNSYIIEITDEASLKQSAQQTVNSFKTDLYSSISSVRQAKESVVAAARTLK